MSQRVPNSLWVKFSQTLFQQEGSEKERSWQEHLEQERSEKFRTFAHSGVYAYNKLEGQWMWSDTGGEEKDSKGDVVTVVVPVSQVSLDQVQIVVLVEQNIMMVVYQQQVSCHRGQQAVR
mgnify:CR=1 FL=1